MRKSQSLLPAARQALVRRWQIDGPERASPRACKGSDACSLSGRGTGSFARKSQNLLPKVLSACVPLIIDGFLKKRGVVGEQLILGLHL